MAKILSTISVFFLLSSCFSSYHIYSVSLSSEEVKYADGHYIIEGNTPNFKFRIFLNQLVEGKVLDLKVKIENASDTLRDVFPEMWAIRFTNFENNTFELEAFNPIEQSIKNHRDITAEERAMRNGYAGGSALVGAGTGAVAVLLGDEDPKPEAEIASDTYRSRRYNKGQSRLSSLHQELDEIRKDWLHRTTLFPMEYALGTVRIKLPDKPKSLVLIFRDGNNFYSLPVYLKRR